MNIQDYIDILEEHRTELEANGTKEDLLEALDYAIDSLKAVDESLNGNEEDEA